MLDIQHHDTWIHSPYFRSDAHSKRGRSAVYRALFLHSSDSYIYSPLIWSSAYEIALTLTILAGYISRSLYPAFIRNRLLRAPTPVALRLSTRCMYLFMCCSSNDPKSFFFFFFQK